MNSPDREHAEFLKRNSDMIVGILEATLPGKAPSRLPLVDELTILVATHQLGTLLSVRSFRGWKHLLEASPPEARAAWTAQDWKRVLRGRHTADAKAPHQLSSLYREIVRRPDFPLLRKCLRWGGPRWRRLLRRIGANQDLAGAVTALILDRSELPSGPLTSQLYWRLGYTKRRHGRPTEHDVAPRDVDRLKWLFQTLAASKCTPQLEPGSTACAGCPVRSFCRAYRRTQARTDPPARGFVDLFAGPGGLSLGLTRAGFQMVCAVDKDRHSTDTLYFNHHTAPESTILRRDVKGILRDPELLASLRGVQVVAGGPPCQAFSMARRHSNADRRDPRRRLVFDFIRVARRLNPIVVLMENVPGIQNAEDGAAFESILRAFKRAGFAVDHRLFNAAAFGVPQNRARVFFIGINKERVGNAEDLLERMGRYLDSLVPENNAPTVRQALCGLPRVIPGEGALVTSRWAPGRSTDYAKRMSNGGSFIFNHQRRPHNRRDLCIFAELKWGETARKFEARNPGRIPYSLVSFGDKYRKLHPGKPSPTIPSHLKRDANSFVHPFVPRGITPREAARLQSFPDDYVFLGGFGPSFVQIGNAVPPLLAEALGRAVAEALP